MAAKSGYPLASVKQAQTHLITIGFTPDGANAPPLLIGMGFSVSTPSTGVYTVTLDDGAFAGTFSASAHYESRTVNSTARAEIRSTANITSAGTFTVATQSSAGTDANLSAGGIVWITMCLAESSIGFRRG